MSTLTDVAASPFTARAPAGPAPILLATDGREQSQGAVAVAAALATAQHAPLHVVTVNTPLMIIGPDAPVPLDPDVESARREELLRLTLAQLSQAHATVPEGDPEVADGDPPRVIARRADTFGARMIVVGLGRHAVIDRLFGDETALALARLARVPVLAVPDDATAAPRRIVVAVDFSEPSVRAAEAAAEIAAAGATLTLVHVRPRERALASAWANDEEESRYIGDALARLREKLATSADLEVNDVVLDGNTAATILRYAEAVDADLVAAGTHGHGFLARLIIGSTTEKLLRAAQCAVLVTPPTALASSTALGAIRHETQPLRRDQWRSALDEFSRRNVGRRTTLEIDDPDLGAQAQEREYPLLGVTYDPHDDRVELMLGDLKAGGRHLSRSIAGASAIDLLADQEGRDLALRVRHGEGQTLLMLLSTAP